MREQTIERIDPDLSDRTPIKGGEHSSIGDLRAESSASSLENKVSVCSQSMSDNPPIKPYYAAAGSWGATAATFQHLAELGVAVKGTGALWRMNKRGGFDCSGCRWPDPRGGEPP